MYIYKIINKQDNKIYVGQTIHPLKDRYEGHLYKAFRENCNTKLYNAMRKYGLKWTYEIPCVETNESVAID